jgi:hypothetical protein
MNKDKAKELLPLIKALADGKTIQEDVYGQWLDAECPTFYREVWNYRVKPEPRTFDVWRNEITKKVIAVEDGDHDKDKRFSEWERITVQEVLK